MSTLQLGNHLAEAISLRAKGEAAHARDLLLVLHRDHPEDAAVNLQCAWVHDNLGLEREALPFYEKAIDLGLDDDDLRNALLGLGSTYRAVGEYDKAVSTLTKGVERFPGDRSMKVFQAMALYNTGQGKKACEILLTVLSETTNDGDLASYRPAIETYAGDLDRVWA